MLCDSMSEEIKEKSDDNWKKDEIFRGVVKKTYMNIKWKIKHSLNKLVICIKKKKTL